MNRRGLNEKVYSDLKLNSNKVRGIKKITQLFRFMILNNYFGEIYD
ncbi:hypothetical protein WOSG25_080540 [Weissella oryzae SG25]|uniref:Uncharacterized protein n=1 Tax=Weissella oryzae (strain DSM 25784 / JCM 18191 / LMG 30913 / SG25) TaxID=1329250 RepID=A0A069CV01_WEIOS|nr:hypothetical protein WOSG25_080540 [Weissella oryzae SG25]